MEQVNSKTTHFRRYLQDELILRSSKNQHYSLRAFARDLGTNHATLSGIFTGKRPLTKKTVLKLAGSLKIQKEQLEKFLSTIDRKSTDPQQGRQEALNHVELSLDKFMTASEWYHDAILELTHTRNFIGDHKQIAKRLGITTTEVNIAVERLIRLNLLEITSKRKWKDLSRNNTTNLTDDTTSVALRNYQKQILEMSMKALEDLPRIERDHTSTMLACQSSDLPQVKKMIKRFRYELAAFIERPAAKPDAVFQFSISAFPITKNESSGGIK